MIGSSRQIFWHRCLRQKNHYERLATALCQQESALQWPVASGAENDKKTLSVDEALTLATLQKSERGLVNALCPLRTEDSICRSTTSLTYLVPTFKRTPPLQLSRFQRLFQTRLNPSTCHSQLQHRNRLENSTWVSLFIMAPPSTLSGTM
jgi:hypothetical protein